MKTVITKEGQPFVYEPVYVHPNLSKVGRVIGAAFESKLPEPIVTHHERIRLRWVKPDGKGGLK